MDVNGHQRTDTTIGRKGLLHVKDENGKLHISADNINITGADVVNDGQGQTHLLAKNNLNLTALSVGFDEKMGGGNHYRNEAVQGVEISRVQGNGDVVLSGQNIYSEGANLDAKKRLALLAQNDIVLNTASQHNEYEESHKTKSGSAISRKTTQQYDNVRELTHKGTELTGESILVEAGNNINAESLLAVSRTGNVELIANNNIALDTATNQRYEKHLKNITRNGILNGGELGVTIGSQNITQENTLDGAIQSDTRNTLASESGNVIIKAGNKATATNIDTIVANDKTAVISGKNGVQVKAGKDVINTTDHYEFRQSGLSLALSTPVTDAIQSAHTSLQQAKATKNDKLKGVYAVKMAEDAVIAAQNASKVADTLGNLSKGFEDNSAAAENPAVKISLSIGTQKQTRNSESQNITHAKSYLDAGNLAIISENGKVVLEGVDTKVKNTLRLDGKEGITSKGVMDSSDNNTVNKNHSASVGGFIGFNGDSYGMGIEAAAALGKGKENAHTGVWQNNQLQAGTFITRSENGKLTVDTTNVKADRWKNDVQALDVISRQDVTKYKSEQVQAGVKGSLTYSSGGGVNANFAYNSAKLNTAQVENQTRIEIGEGGIDSQVQGNTHIDGAIITSKAALEHNRFQTDTLTTHNIQNHSELETRSLSVSGGSSGISPTSALSLLGNKNESRHSTTSAAISENISITITDEAAQQAKTGKTAAETLQQLNRDTANANQKVAKHSLTEVQETQALVKGIAEIAEKAMQIYTHNERENIEQAKLALGKAKTQQASQAEIDKLTDNLTALQKHFDKQYGTGSPTKRAVDAVTAVLQGFAAKDLGQAAVGLASPYLNEQIKLHTKNADGSVNTTVNLIAHALLGAVEAAATGNNLLAGAAAGATSEATANVIINTLYQGKSADQLTESEKQNVVFLSQLASGFAAGIVGDSTPSAAIGTDVGKRAVENNSLLDAQISDLFKKLEKAEKAGQSLEEVFVEAKALSDKQLQDVQENYGSALCRYGVEKTNEEANQKALELVGFFNSRLSTLSDEAQERFIEFVINENAKEIDFINEARTPIEKAVVLLVEAFVEGRENREVKISPKIASFARKAKTVSIPNKTVRVKGARTNDFIFEKAPYHSKTGNTVKSANPTFGQEVLNESIQIKNTSTRRVGVDKSTGEYVVFDQTRDSIYHGHIRKWDELTTEMKNALKKANLVNDKGKIK